MTTIADERVHKTDSALVFRMWIPELSPKVFKHFRVKRVEVLVQGNDGEDVALIYEKNEKEG